MNNIGLIAALAKALGGGGGSSPSTAPMIVNGSVVSDTITLDKTWKQIHDAFVAGTTVLLHITEEDIIDFWTTINSVTHGLVGPTYVVSDGHNTDYTAETENGYPSVED